MAANFNERVWRALEAIPRGKVTTYRALAEHIGHRAAYRAVGNALNKNPFGASSGLPAGRQVPCHRVVRSDGTLGGYAGGPEKKILLLRKEGVSLKDGKIDLKKYGWDRPRKSGRSD